MIKHAAIKRVYSKEQTNGSFFLAEDNFECHSLELPWKDNKFGISCIPEGNYLVLPDNTGRYQWFKVTDVPNRTHIEIHEGSFFWNYEGCIGLGLETMDINNDGLMDIRHCKPALRRLKRLAPEGFWLNIYS